MASGGDVLNMLLPNGRFVVYGDDYESIVWFDDNKITKKQFEEGFAQYDAWKDEQDATKAAQKAALLERLGITGNEARLLLG